MKVETEDLGRMDTAQGLTPDDAAVKNFQRRVTWGNKGHFACFIGFSNLNREVILPF